MPARRTAAPRIRGMARGDRGVALLRPLDITVPDNTGRDVAAIPVGGYYHDRSAVIPQRMADYECGGCGARVAVYVWSFSGSGKRCPQCHGNLKRFLA